MFGDVVGVTDRNIYIPPVHTYNCSHMSKVIRISDEQQAWLDEQREELLGDEHVSYRLALQMLIEEVENDE